MLLMFCLIGLQLFQLLLLFGKYDNLLQLLHKHYDDVSTCCLMKDYPTNA